jgi:hypothetical protein
MILKYAMKNLYRQRKHSLLMISVAFILFLLFYRFIINIKVDEEEISRLYKTVEVTGLIKQRETDFTRKPIPMELVDQLVDTGFIDKEALDTVYYAFTFSPYGNVPVKRIDNKNHIDLASQANIIGASDLKNCSLLPKGLNITLADGYDVKMFSENRPICIADSEFLKRNQLSYGDSIGILGEFANEFYIYNDVPPEKLTQELSKGLVFTICGSYEYNYMSKSFTDPYMLGDMDFIVPVRALLNNFDKYYFYNEP